MIDAFLARYSTAARIVCGVLAVLSALLAALAAYTLATAQRRSPGLVVVFLSQLFVTVVLGKLAVSGKGFRLPGQQRSGESHSDR